MKKVKSREKQVLHILPGSIIRTDWKAYTGGIREGNSIQGICLYQALDQGIEAPVLKRAIEFSRDLDTELYLQGAADAGFIKTKLPAGQGRTTLGKVYYFAGETAVSWSRGKISLSGWAPAAFTWLEGLIETVKSGWSVRDGILKLDDRDVIIEGKEGRSCREIFPRERWTELRDEGINAVNGIRGKDVVMFLQPLSLAIISP